MSALRASALALSFIACTGHDSTTSPVPASSTPQSYGLAAAPTARALAPVTSPTPVAAASLYDLRVALLDDMSTVRSLDTFRGHPVLITMFYGSCPVACPLLTSDLKRLEQQIPEPMRSDVRMLMVSFDSERDTPAALARMKEERGLNSGHWTLASTGPEEARELAGALDIKYRKLDNGAFFHSSVIVLLDRQGRPLARVEGVTNNATAVLTALTAPSI